MIRLRHPYRDFQKNLFLGEEMVLRMSDTPEGDGGDDTEPPAATGGGAGGAGTPPTPPPAAPDATPAAPEGPIYEAPKDGNQVPPNKPLTKEQLEAQLKNKDGSQNLLKTGFEKGVEKGLYNSFKDVVKDTPELEIHGEFETHWISKLGDYNGVQNQIDHFVQQKKRLSDDKFIKDSPDFKAEFKKVYQEMLAAIQKGPIKISPETLRRIQENAKQEVTENYKAAKRAPLIKAIDEVIESLIEERRKQFLELMEYMLDNLKRRIIFLIEKWQVAPPLGYEDVQEEWIEYCVELLETLDKTDFSTLDLSKPDFPEMDKHFALAKDWWYSVSLFEDTYKDFNQAGKQELSRETLQAQFSDLEKNAQEKLTDKKVHDYQSKLDAVTAEIDKLLPELEAKSKDKSLDKAERELRASEIFTLKNAKQTLLEKRDIKTLVNDTLYSEEVLTDKAFSRSGVKLEIKKGLKHQLDFFNSAPLNSQERRLLMRSMNDGMKEMKQAFDNIEVEANVQFVETLNKLRLYRESLTFTEGPVTQEVIWINPFEAWGHVWHSVTTTIKGNVETEAKRGAGYLQKQGTKWMEKVPNPTNNQVIKSFKEFSANGEQEAEHAEHGRVGDIQKGYEGFNTEHLYHLAAETSDRWEFKACLNLLADRGRVNWYDPWIYTQLNRWQKTVKLPTDPNWHRTYITASDDMLRQAFIYIYRVTDDFKNLKNKNTSSWESKKGEFKKGLGLLAAEPGGLKREADKLLDKFKDDHHNHIHFSKADPIKYEAIIEYAIEQGKMNGEDRMYYINHGIAEGFLPFDRGAELTKLNNTYPPVDRYDSGSARGDRPTIFDVKEWACHDKVTNMYDVFETLSDNAATNQRANKTISQGQNRVDHDDAPMLAGHIDAETMQRILSANGQGGYGLPATGLQSLVVGHELWLDMYAHRFSQKKKEFNDAQLTRFVTMVMRFDGITSRQMYANQTTFWRLDESVASSEEPRTVGLYKQLFGHETLRGDGSNKIKDYIGSVKGYLELLDFDSDFALIKKLNNKELKTTDSIKDFISGFRTKYNDEITDKIFGKPPVDNIDKMYEVVIPAYIKYITEKETQRVQTMVDAINNDHKKVWDAQDEARRKAEHDNRAPTDSEISFRHRMEQVEKRKAAVRAEAFSVAQGHDTSHDEHHDDHHGDEEGGGGHGHHRKKPFYEVEKDENGGLWAASPREQRNSAQRSSW